MQCGTVHLSRDYSGHHSSHVALPPPLLRARGCSCFTGTSTTVRGPPRRGQITRCTGIDSTRVVLVPVPGTVPVTDTVQYQVPGMELLLRNTVMPSSILRRACLAYSVAETHPEIRSCTVHVRTVKVPVRVRYWSWVVHVPGTVPGTGTLLYLYEQCTERVKKELKQICQELPVCKGTLLLVVV